MNTSVKNAILKYGISSAVAILLIALYIGGRDFAGAAAVEKYRMLCDAFYIPGILFLMVWALVWASSKGAMDGLSFLVQNMVRSLLPGGKVRTSQKYYDYIVERKERRKATSSYRFLLVVGGVCFAVSMVFMYLFYRVR